MEFYASCAGGFESYLAGELRFLGVQSVRPLTGGASFQTDLQGAYRVCMYTRLASRVLMPLVRVDADSTNAFYEGIYQFPWEDHLSPQLRFALEARGANDALRNPNFAVLKAKDALVDRLREKTGQRPEVDTKDPQLRLMVRLRKKNATLYLDLGGGSLHRRAYRTEGKQTLAPLKENLAACVLAAGGWYKHCRDEIPCLVDPLCGSGTLAIEAALQALDRAPGLIRPHWGFTHWLGHQSELWDEILDEADERAEAAQDRKLLIFASDKDGRALELAKHNAHKAQVLSTVQFRQADIKDLRLPVEFLSAERSLLVANPPYAERMGSMAELPPIYQGLSAVRSQLGTENCTVSLITPDPLADAAFGGAPDESAQVMNGPIPSQIRVYFPERAGSRAAADIQDQYASTHDAHVQGRSQESSDKPMQPSPFGYALGQSEQFHARLKKVYKQRRKWAQKHQVSAYRVYDADLPDYKVAIDVFEGAAADKNKRLCQIAEYQAPKEIPDELVHKRMHDILLIVPEVFDIDPADIICKTRMRARGGSQYAQTVAQERARRAGREHTEELIVQEHGLLFKLKLGQYLDYGLFLDHRDTRQMIYEMARGKRFLNLFSYTGSVTCHAAAGGARETTSVDLSNTYLQWAEENLRLNGYKSCFDKDGVQQSNCRHKLVRFDCMAWIKMMRKSLYRWDLIFCDPPTFSNSAKMKRASFDVQRDHLDLMIGISRLLTQEGSAIFSCNLRNFKPDLKALERAGVEVEDISEKTIPLDFERNKKIHHCYLLRRSKL